MSATLLLDENVSFRVKYLLTDLSLEILHVDNLNLNAAQDPRIYQYARKPNWFFATFDKDYLSLFQKHGPPPRLIFIRTPPNYLSASTIKAMANAIRSAIADMNQLNLDFTEVFIL